MAVFTAVTLDDVAQWIKQFPLGKAEALKGIASGIENSNFFLTTERGEYVLTIFENLSFEQLPFYLELMRHLAERGVLVPAPVANDQGQLVTALHGKPAAIVSKLEGSSQMAPLPAHCAAVGAMLAKMHLAAQDFPLQQPNLRGLDWWNATTPAVLPFLDNDNAHLLRAEMHFQDAYAACDHYKRLARGPVHADLFRNNVMFVGERLTGFFDFYFAGCDTWLFDVAVTVNDWCIDLDTGVLDPARVRAMLDAYHAVRPFSADDARRRAALLALAPVRFLPAARSGNAHAARPVPLRAHFARTHRHRCPRTDRMTHLPARTGWEWIGRSFELFRKQPGMLTTILMLNFFASVLIGVVPFIGPLLASVLIPSLSMAIMQACTLIEQGQRATPAVLLTGFRKPQVVNLCKLGLVYLGISVALSIALEVSVSDDFMKQFSRPVDPATRPQFAQSDMLAVLCIYLSLLAALLALCFAAPLAHWQKMAPLKACFYSFFAVLGAARAFIILLLSLFGIFVTVMALLGVLFGGNDIGRVLILWTTMMMVLLLQCAIYAGYRQIFGYTEQAQADA
jgi:homoserine kinase type II